MSNLVHRHADRVVLLRQPFLQRINWPLLVLCLYSSCIEFSCCQTNWRPEIKCLSQIYKHILKKKSLSAVSGSNKTSYFKIEYLM